MKSLEQIKNDYAVSKEFENWRHLLTENGYSGIERHENEVMKIYAMECLKLASDNAEANHHPININWVPVVIKGSITDEKNIIK